MTQDKYSEAQVALNKAKIGLMSKPDSAFFTTICFNLRFEWDENIPTACVDGKTMKLNPEFFLSLGKEERIFVLVHESMHVALMHMGRLKDREPQKWNIAADHVINLMLLERGYSMPNWVLKDPQYKGMSTDEVYNLLPKPPEDGSGNKMSDLAPPEVDDETFKQEVEDILVRAAMQSKMQGDAQGTVPGDIQIYLDNLLNPKMPWHRILRKYMQSKNKQDYSMAKPNRRFFPKYHLPSLYSDAVMDMTFAVDSSGSVSDHDFKVFVSEVNGVLKLMKPEKLTLIQFDTSIKSVDKLRNISDLMHVKFQGRGGTHIGEVMEWAKTNKPNVLLMFTDGEFRFQEGMDPGVDVIWLIHNNPTFTAPFGKVIHYEIK